MNARTRTARATLRRRAAEHRATRRATRAVATGHQKASEPTPPTTPTAKPTVTYSIETMTAIGGNRWQRAGYDRVYLDWMDFVPLDVDRYNAGKISSAAWKGEGIANRQAGLIIGSIDKVYFDNTTGKLHCRYGYGESRVATREEVWGEVVAGVRAAIAAL